MWRCKCKYGGSVAFISNYHFVQWHITQICSIHLYSYKNIKMDWINKLKAPTFRAILCMFALFSFSLSRSSSLFIFGYAVFYFNKHSHMFGMLQTVEYFGYTILICYSFFLILGTISFFASLKFVRYIYQNIKMDWIIKEPTFRTILCSV